jgi:hypothetical protein
VSRSTENGSFSIIRPFHDSDVVESQNDEVRGAAEPFHPHGLATYSDPCPSAVDSSASLLALVNGMQAACEMLGSSPEDNAVSYTAWIDGSPADREYLVGAGARLAREYSFGWEVEYIGDFFNIRFSTPVR